ncbi:MULTISPECIES: YutD family protein [Aerococcus]|uniref:YutD family protein n=1 Tax=Aerococcus TaxID=1375 RepID=UPI0018A7D641|nr:MULTISPECIES: YutD family protein [Aerococcus]MCY3035699.1 YutD family protein [Aerococcus sp. Group 2]MCY3039833.1 YutD family protein [Aerococcus sp. Group 2]MCY3040367.1 YutD family protein [Aerococcus sp. Group 2]MCY3043291.1 YutD family protein [Aerococcus sp. Group 2]MDK6519811.1 YutD family protein [Aerococcus urinae]
MSQTQDRQAWIEQRKSDNYIFADVIQQADDRYLINGQAFQVVKDAEAGIDKQELANRYMDILDSYDYVVGDWSFQQLRLKGFYEDKLPHTGIDQQISFLDDYLYEYCSFGCDYFVLKHLRSEEEINERNRQLKSKRNNQNSKRKKRRNSRHNNQGNNHKKASKKQTKTVGKRFSVKKKNSSRKANAVKVTDKKTFKIRKK